MRNIYTVLTATLFFVLFSPWNAIAFWMESYGESISYVQFRGDAKSYASVNNNSIFNFPQDFSVLVWINGNNLSSKQRRDIVTKGKAGDYEWLLSINPQKKAYFIIFNTNATNYLSVTSSTTLNEGSWYHLAAVYNGSSALIYVNGILERTSSQQSGKKEFNGAAKVYLGSRETIGGDSPFNGSIDDVIIYNKSLDKKQIKRIFRENAYGSNWGVSLPVLSYHIIRDPASDTTKVTPLTFSIQMQYLNNSGYHTITYDDYYQWRQENFTLPKKSIIIVFDDDSDTVWKNATPVMDIYGYVGVIGLVTKRADELKGYMNWSIISTLKEKGWQIAAHSVQHLEMTNLSYDERVFQFNESKNAIIANLSLNPLFWIFPFSARNYSIETECSLFYTMCSGTSSDTNKIDNFLFKKADLIHVDALPIGMRRIVIANITTMQEFIDAIDYFDGVVGHWNFAEISGDLALDSSGYGNDALLYNSNRVIN